MATILRWHINRIYEREKSMQSPKRRIEVTITPAVDNISELINSDNLKDLAKQTSDNLECWQLDEDQLEGWTTEIAIMYAVQTKSLFPESIENGAALQERKVEEDMVFLHFVENESSLKSAWDDLKEKPPLPDVSPLVDIDDAYWIDFTQQARKMSATLYRKILSENEEGSSAK